MDEHESKLATYIKDTLSLDLDLGSVSSDTSLYEAGFGLDSIDLLELSLSIPKEYGVMFRSDDENTMKVFASLGALNTYIQQHRTI